MVEKKSKTKNKKQKKKKRKMNVEIDRRRNVCFNLPKAGSVCVNGVFASISSGNCLTRSDENH